MLVNAIWSPIRIKGGTFDWSGVAPYHLLDCRRGGESRRKRLFLCQSDLAQQTGFEADDIRN